MNWNKEFYDQWDRFVKNWWDANAQPSDSVTNGFKKGRHLDLGELPEPYLGSPQGAKVVIINYNPGMSAPNEDTKFYKTYNRRDALITKFVDEYDRSYHRFVKDWSALNSALDKRCPSIPGVKWWKGRFKWIERFMKHFPCKVADGFCIRREEVFALEICPYHSKSWQGRLEDQSVINHVKKFVIIPAACAALENDLPCVICVGDKIGEVLRDQFNLRLISKWDEGLDDRRNRISDWPKGKSGSAKRKYELLEMDGSRNYQFNEAIGTSKVLFLVLSSTGSNKLPGASFDKVETLQIVSRIREIWCKH